MSTERRFPSRVAKFFSGSGFLGHRASCVLGVAERDYDGANAVFDGAPPPSGPLAFNPREIEQSVDLLGFSDLVEPGLAHVFLAMFENSGASDCQGVIAGTAFLFTPVEGADFLGRHGPRQQQLLNDCQDRDGRAN